MRIEVAAFANLRRYLPELKLGQTRSLDIAPGTTARQVADQLGLPVDEVQVVMRNHAHATLDDILEEDDRHVFIPLIDGG
jgi:hypothetical protein